MPKRTIHDIDSEDSYSLQSKIHVSNKEINQGIGAASNMKEVYRRTLDLLFRGAKTRPEQQTPIPQVADNEQLKTCDMVVTESGMIRQFSPVRELPISTKCLSCSIHRLAGFERCRFCEGHFCEGCFRPCERCYGNYCARCSIQMYSREESCICLSCATTRGQM